MWPLLALAIQALAACATAAEPDAVIVLRERIIRVAESGEADTTLHEVVQVNTPHGRELFSQAQFLYDPALTRLRASRLARLTPTGDGGWDEQAFNPAAACEDEGSPEGLRSLVLHFPYAEPGQRIEYEVERHDAPPFGRHFSTVMLMGDIVPVSRSRLEIRAPRAMKLWRRFWGCSPVEDVSREDDSVRYAWTREEETRPASPAPRVFVSTERNWNECGRWARRVYSRALQTTPTIHDAAARNLITEGAREERLRRALEFVRQQIRDGSPAGGSATVPTKPDATLQAGRGDCKAKAALLIALLTEAGIPACPVLLDMESGIPLDEQLPSPHVFSHCAVRVRLRGESVLLDPTALQPPFPLSSDGKVVGLVVPLGGGKPRLERFEREQR